MSQISSSDIVQSAQSWIGTPYQHQASVCQQGADCLGLLRGIWRELYGAEPQQAPPYTADWSETSGEERLWSAARKHLHEVPASRLKIGNAVLFRMRSQAVAKHVALISGRCGNDFTIIHAYTGVGVVETPLSPAWVRRIVAQFEFPDRSS